MNSCRQSENSYRLLEKGGLPGVGLGQGHCDLGSADSDGDPRQPGAGTEIQKGSDLCWNCAGAGDAFDKVPRQDSILITNGSEIYASVPANKERNISAKPFRLFRPKWRKSSFV